MLPVSMECPFLIVPLVSSNVYVCIQSNVFCLCLWSVNSWLSLWFPLTFIYVVSLMYATCVYGVSILIIPLVSSNIYLCSQSNVFCLCLWSVHSWLFLWFPLTFIYVVSLMYSACVYGVWIHDCPFGFL
jgi:hypothetical protein